MVAVTARTLEDAMPCPVCETPTAKVHGYHGRTVADVPVDARQVVVRLRVRRLVCPVLECGRQTFREQIPGLLERHQRRTVRLAGQISQVARELCGRAAARLAGLLAVPVSRSTALRHLRSLPVPKAPVPRVIGVDDFALAAATATPRSSRMPRPAGESRRCPTARPRRWSPGCVNIPGSTSCAGTARPPMPKPSAALCPTRSRSATDGTSGATSVPRSSSRFAPTLAAGSPSTRPVPAESASRRPANAGTRSTISSARASACSTAPAAWACP